jgi:hypothetical protein
MTAARRAALAHLATAGLGALLVLWAAGPRMLDPREVGWVMRGDWQIHFLGWHFFRHEPWHWPPGIITGLMQPIGTSLGYTDAIPLMAFLFKPLSAWLPPAFQYLGIWLLVCFALQGFFGALVMSTWTGSRFLQVLGAVLFLLLPTLAARIAHPALCAHWLLLWALWLNWRAPVTRARDLVDHAALGLASGLVHPYLSVMTVALLLALAARRSLRREMPAVRALASWTLASGGIVFGWWMSGLFTLVSATDVTASSGAFSMNLLAMVNPGAIPSTFLDGFPAVSAAQLGEGYQYLGFGVLILCGVAIVLAVKSGVSLRSSIPLLVVLFALTIYSILPVVAIGRHVLVDVSQVEAFRLFRSTGRFFWPAAYALVAASIGMVVSRTPRPLAAALLILAVGLQAVDLREWWQSMHQGSRTDAFFAWDTPYQSSAWGHLLPAYDHMRVYYPSYCPDGMNAAAEGVAYLAGLYGLTINDGFAARQDTARQRQACADFERDFTSGALDPATVYVMAPARAAAFQGRLGDAVACREIDGVGVCVSRESVSDRSRAPEGREPAS